nr:unnamed protein product [Callosobruchus chinensis]
MHEIYHLISLYRYSYTGWHR